MIIVVSDTSPIRALDFINQLPLLNSMFGRVLVPPMVAYELRNPSTALRSIDITKLDYVDVVRPTNLDPILKLGMNLDAGESEALALAVEKGAKLVMIDESTGRTAAMKLGLKPIGVIGILLRGKARHEIEAIRPLLDRLQTELNFFISTELRENTLKDAGED